MHERLLVGSSLLLVTSLCAQSTYQVGGLPSQLAVQVFNQPALPSPPIWATSLIGDDVYGALQYSSAGVTAVTVVLAFVAPDPDYQPNINVLATLRTLYPFIDHPELYWKANDQALLNLNVDFDNAASDSVVIPPARIAAVVAAALGAPASFGPVGAVPPTLYTRPAVSAGAWPATVELTDERHTLSGWWNETRTIVRVDQLGRRALEVAAFQWSSQVHPDAVAELDTMIRQTYQWAISLQAVQITPPPTENDRPRLRLSNPVKVRRRSLAAQQEDPWLAMMGPSRATPFLLMPGQRLNLAGLNELLFVDLAGETVGADCQAFVPIQGGGWATLPRVITFGNHNLLELQEHIAVFECPGNAVHGIGFVSRTNLTPISTVYPVPGSGPASFAIYVFETAAPITAP